MESQEADRSIRCIQTHAHRDVMHMMDSGIYVCVCVFVCVCVCVCFVHAAFHCFDEMIGDR